MIFNATGDTLQVFGVPVAYVPAASGSIDQSPFPLRDFSFGDSKRFGSSLTTEWGVYELAGVPRPQGLDLSFLADYFDKRGPATGLNGNYSGSNIDSDTGDVTDFSGKFNSFFIDDRGTDEFGENRSDVTPPDETRGKFLFEHQQFFPDHWQAQLRYGYVSDPTFMEEYFPREFFDNQPYDAVAYLKRQEDSEAITFLLNADTNRFVTTSDQQQEQFDVERLPELGYHRIGDSFGGDNFTYYGDTTVDRLRFDKSHFSLADQGFVNTSPGLPSEGYTGTAGVPDWRGTPA